VADSDTIAKALFRALDNSGLVLEGRDEAVILAALREAASAPPEAPRPDLAAIEGLVHAFADAHRAAAVVPEDASIREHRAAIVTTDEAYCALLSAIRSLAAPPEASGLRRALEQIRDYEPEREAFRLDNEACPDCKRNRERQWPPSGLCEKHYCQVDDNRRANSDVDARQHYRMREIARAALAATPDARPDPRNAVDALLVLRRLVGKMKPGAVLCGSVTAYYVPDNVMNEVRAFLASFPASPQATTPAPSHDAKE
jgi:hypothetical protein